MDSDFTYCIKRHALRYLTIVLAFTAFTHTSLAQADSNSFQNAQFKGGREAMLAFIQSNIAYPKKAERRVQEGDVHVVFLLNTDGSISEVRSGSRYLPKQCWEEAERIVRLMDGMWTPAQSNGSPSKQRISLHVEFKLPYHTRKERRKWKANQKKFRKEEKAAEKEMKKEMQRLQ